MGDEKKEFTIPHDVRTFFRVGGGMSSLLGRTGGHLVVGDEVLIGKPRTMTYDHQDKLAFPIDLNGIEYFLLQDELQLPEFVEMANEVKARFEAQFEKDDAKSGEETSDERVHLVLITNLPEGWTGSPEEQVRLLTRDDAEKYAHQLEGTHEEVSRQLDGLLAKIIAEDDQILVNASKE